MIYNYISYLDASWRPPLPPPPPPPPPPLMMPSGPQWRPNMNNQQPLFPIHSVSYQNHYQE
jgi:hypothetical protein